MTIRRATVSRKTRETDISVAIDLDGQRAIEIATGIGFLDHLLHSLAFHACWDLSLRCAGDLEIDDHHTAEDCALALGEAIDKALGDRCGINRFGWAYAPLDEALARAVVDCSGRPWPQVDLGLKRASIGGLACENIEHVVTSLAMSMRAAVHLDVERGANDHHRAEGAFKALALALRQALALGGSGIPSTKGDLAGGGP